MRYNDDSFARFTGGAVKLARPEAEVDTFSGVGHVTMGNGQVFRFEVAEVTPEEAAAEAAGWPEGTEKMPGGAGPAGRFNGHGFDDWWDSLPLNLKVGESCSLAELAWEASRRQGEGG